MRVVVALVISVLAMSVVSFRATADAPADLAYEVVSRRPHDDTAFTQGLQLGPDGRLYESTGLYGRSTVRELDPFDGRVIRSVPLPDIYFAEGLTLVGDYVIQLTWRAGQALVRDRATFDVVDVHAYEGEGWGLCLDDERLVMSDGSARLAFRDPQTFEVTGEVDVTLAGEPVPLLNELECVDGSVWANVWQTDRIVRIDPLTGVVDGILDLSDIIDPHPADQRSGSVLNGIAWDRSADTFLVTGKRWPELIEIRLLPASTS